MPGQHPPASLTAFLRTAPENVVRSLTVLSAGVSLTDEVASELINRCAPLNFEPKDLLDYLRVCDFVIERNSEWHFEPTARAFLLRELYKESDLAKAAHTTLLHFAEEADPDQAGDTVPTYLTLPVGLAYHTAFFDYKLGLDFYLNSYSGHPTGDQWLLGVLAEEQQETGLIPTSAIEPAFFQGMTAYREGRWQDAERYFLRVAKNDQIRQEVAYATHILGQIFHVYRHDDRQAEQLLRRSVTLGEKLGDLHHQSIALHSLGRLLSYRKPTEAEECLRRSLEINTFRGNLYGQAQVLHSLADLISDEKPDEAEQLLRRSLALGERLNNSSHQAQVLQKLGLLIASKNLDEAEELLRRSILLNENSNDISGLILNLNSLANIISSKKPDEAEQFLRRALKIAERTNNSALGVSILKSLGLLVASKNIDEAEQLLLRALRIEERRGNQHGQAWVLTSLGNIQRQNENWVAARSYYEQVLALTKNPTDLAVAHLGLSYIAEYYEDNLGSAIQHMEQAIKYQLQTNKGSFTKRHKDRLQSLKRKARK